MAAYTLARVKRIASTAVHVDFKLVFGAAFEQGWFVSSNTLRFFCDEVRLLLSTIAKESKHNRTTKYQRFYQAASPINTKILGNRVETIAFKTQSATYCFGNNPGWRQLRMHEMSPLTTGEVLSCRPRVPSFSTFVFKIISTLSRFISRPFVKTRIRLPEKPVLFALLIFLILFQLLLARAQYFILSVFHYSNC